MSNKSIALIIVAILIVGAIFYFQHKEPTIACTLDAKICPDGSSVSRIAPDCEFATCPTVVTGDLIRGVPLSVSPGQKFNVNYTSNKSGKWGVIVVDHVSGGCTFEGGSTQSKQVILSEYGPHTEILKVNAPSSGSCTFYGDYNFDENIIKFANQTVSVA
jgi:hypothetical protein